MKSKFFNAELATTAFLNIDKPKGITSHDVISRVRKMTGIKQVGHAGTLDPMATGVMVVALGKACRLLRFLTDDKSYKAAIRLGLVTDTDDIEGRVLQEDSRAITHPPTTEVIATALYNFVGTIEQVPPYYSAIHIDGKRLYELARAGDAPPEIKPRSVTIESIDLLSYTPPTVTIGVRCSKGTYIRSIARDLGERLGLGGTLSDLVRESSGCFTLDQASNLDELAGSRELFQSRLIKIEDAIKLPTLVVSDAHAKRLIMGQKIGEADLELATLTLSAAYVLLINGLNGSSFCIGRIDIDELDGQRYLAPEVVFADV